MPKLLTVDDERDFTDMIRSFFEPRGYTVFVASNGEDGLRIAEAEKPEVALIDLKMPGMHGDEVLKRMRTLSPGTVPIMITASEGELKTRERLLEMGAFGCFDKPITSLKELETKIKEALAKK
jgi:DNA-binding response OmpR family regulator